MGLHKRMAEQDMVEGKYQGLPQISWCWTSIICTAWELFRNTTSGILTQNH